MDYISLSDIATYKQGKQIPVEEQSLTCEEGMKRFVRIIDYTDPNEPPRYINDLGEQYEVDENGIVMIRYGSKTAGSVVRGISGIIANNMFQVCIDKNYDNDYMYYYLSSAPVKQMLMGAQSSSTMPAITFGMMKQIMVPIRSLEEQKKIASVLLSIDKKIKNGQRILHNIEEQINAYYRARFVTFEGYDQTVEGEMGKQPQGWNVVSLKDVTKNIKTKVGDSSDEIKVLSAVNTGELVFSEEYFNKQVFSKDISKYIVVQENEFAYNPARVNIGSIGINDTGVKGCVSPVYVVFRVESGYENYMRYLIRTKRFKTEVATRASGSVRQAVNYVDFGLIRVIYPPKNEVEDFNIIVEPLHKKRKIIEKELLLLNEIKEFVVPALMEGKVDLSRL